MECVYLQYGFNLVRLGCLKLLTFKRKNYDNDKCNKQQLKFHN